MQNNKLDFLKNHFPLSVFSFRKKAYRPNISPCNFAQRGQKKTIR